MMSRIFIISSIPSCSLSAKFITIISALRSCFRAAATKNTSGFNFNSNFYFSTSYTLGGCSRILDKAAIVMFNTTFNFTKFPLPLRVIQFHYCRWLVNTKPKITILSASENRLRVYPYTVRFWLESEHDNFFFPPFSRLYNEKITRNAENVPHLALIKQNSEHKNHKNDSRVKVQTSALSSLEDFHAERVRNIAQPRCFEPRILSSVRSFLPGVFHTASNSLAAIYRIRFPRKTESLRAYTMKSGVEVLTRV